MVAVVIGATLLALLAVGIIPRLTSRRALEAAVVNEANGKPIVSVVAAKRAAAVAELTLPGSVQAQQQTAVYARTSGYVRRLYVDIGERVKAGQLLADIETPESDQELRQARASLVRARATLSLATSSLARFRTLATGGVVTAQEFEERQATFETTQAAVAEAEAYVERLLAREAAKRVKAPFSGTVTARNVDIGSLISAAGANSAGGNSVPGAGAMFIIAQTDTVRIMVSIPQSNAPEILIAQRADVAVREFPSRTFEGTVARTSTALDPTTRTMQVEIEIPNRDRALMAGMYASVRFSIERSRPALLIPSASLLTTGALPRVAIVRPDGRVEFRTVEVARDLGAMVELLSGVDAGDMLIINPSDELAAGLAVESRVVPEDTRAPANTPAIPPAKAPAKAPANARESAPRTPNAARASQPPSSH